MTGLASTADGTQTERGFFAALPGAFRTIVERDTRSTGFDVGWAYGSSFARSRAYLIHVARSEVGAGGLMQVMPNTAEMVARKIKILYDLAGGDERHRHEHPRLAFTIYR